MPITVKLTAAHKGHFSFRVCKVTQTAQEKAQLTEDCFKANQLVRLHAACLR